MQTQDYASHRDPGQRYYTTDAVREFAEFAASYGVLPPVGGFIDDDKVQRADAGPDRADKSDATYILAVDAVTGFGYGWVCNHKGDGAHRWQSSLPAGYDESGTEREVRQARMAEQRRKVEEERQNAIMLASESARQLWDDASPATSDHPYLKAKGILPHGVRQGRDGRLMIPIRCPNGMRNIEFVAWRDGKGHKSRVTGAQAKDGLFQIPGSDETIAIVEGFATGASVAQATGYSVAVSFGKNNLLSVAKQMHEKHPTAEIIVAGDNDAEGGPEAAREAAQAVSGRAAIPVAPGMDWNDVHATRGLGAVLEGISPPLTISAATLAGLPVPLRQWIVEGIIPRRVVTLLYGDGGLGKSLLAMQLGVSVATGTNWIGHPSDTGPALYLGAEDEQDEMHIRLTDICAAHGVGLADLTHLHIRSLVGEDALLATSKSQYTQLEPSDLYHRLVKEVRRVKPKLVVLDTLADLYPSDENYKTHVRQFMGFLKKIALDHDCAIVVLAHPSKSGMAEGRGDSGNVAWNGSARARLYLTRPTDEEANPDERVLEVKKLNAGKAGDAFKLQWEAGAFKLKQGTTMLDKMAMDAKAVRVFLNLLRVSNETGVPVSESRAEATFARDPDREGVTKTKFREVKTRLLRDGKIKVVQGARSARHLVISA